MSKYVTERIDNGDIKQTKKNIIAVDFDGTLCTNKYPDIGEPNKNLIAYLKKRQSNGDKLILWTSRNEDQTRQAVEWCKAQGLTFDAVNENLPEIIEAFGGDSRKIFANEYIDDRNLMIELFRENPIWNYGLRMRLLWRVSMRRQNEKMVNGITVVPATRVL